MKKRRKMKDLAHLALLILKYYQKWLDDRLCGTMKVSEALKIRIMEMKAYIFNEISDFGRNDIIDHIFSVSIIKINWI